MSPNMSQQHSPQSSTGRAPASSPFAGTDPTLYSPELTRDAKHRSAKSSIHTVVGSGKNVNVGIGINFDKPTLLPAPAAYVHGAFSNEVPEGDAAWVSRFQHVVQLPDGTVAGHDQEHEMFSVQHQMKLYACFSTCIPSYVRGVMLRFDDLRDAGEAKDILEQHGFIIDNVTGYSYALAKSQDTAQLNEYEGQIEISIKVDPNPDHASWEFTSNAYNTVQIAAERVCETFGPVRAVVHIDTHDTTMELTFRVEFYSVDAANRAVASLTTDPIWGVDHEKSFQWFTVKPALYSGERINSPQRIKPRMDDQGRIVGFRPALGTAMPPMDPYHRHPADQHNRVRRERILDGSDVRTTVMLRNIPNKLDWLALKTILDDACFGTYDFVYLRIDFKSACNVGYAFINFSDVHGMIALLDKIERRCWIGYRSTKAAEISYATIQGREALIQKFRNSSVMQETPFCRPRLFFTYTDAELTGKLRSAGVEQAFPRPDNLSKLQRSMDSARTIGLFPPHGFSSTTEHRNRPSAYDRGTPRDMIQAAMHYARHRAAPVPFHALDDSTKREIEMWYSCIYGQGSNGCIPFDFIPMSHISQYFAEHPASAGSMPVNHGVIGGPVHTFGQPSAIGSSAHGYPQASSGRGVFGSPARGFNQAPAMTTPTRGSRMFGSPAYPRNGRAMASEYATNPFM